MAKVQLGDVLLIHLGNRYHEWRMRDMARKLGYPINRIEVTKQTLPKVKQLQYASLQAGREIIWLVVDGYVKDFVETFKRVSPAKRIYVVEMNNRNLAKEMVGLKARRLRVVPLKRVKTYEEKREVLRKLVKRWSVVFDSQKTEKILLRLMMQNEESWGDVRVTLEIFKETGHICTEKDVEDMYPDSELYQLSEWLDRVLRGNVKRKTMQMLHYYLHTKQYNVSWMLNKLREDILNLSYVYQAYRRGILRVPTEKAQLQERLDTAGWEDGFPLLEIKIREQERYLQYAREIPYRSFISIQECVFSYAEYIRDEEDLYAVLLQIQNHFVEKEKEAKMELLGR